MFRSCGVPRVSGYTNTMGFFVENNGLFCTKGLYSRFGDGVGAVDVFGDFTAWFGTTSCAFVSATNKKITLLMISFLDTFRYNEILKFRIKSGFTSVLTMTADAFLLFEVKLMSQ